MLTTTTMRTRSARVNYLAPSQSQRRQRKFASNEAATTRKDSADNNKSENSGNNNVTATKQYNQRSKSNKEHKIYYRKSEKNEYTKNSATESKETKDEFVVNGMRLFNPIVVLEDAKSDECISVDALVDALQRNSFGTPRRRRKLFGTSPYVLRGGRAVGARRHGILRLNKNIDVSTQNNVSMTKRQRQKSIEISNINKTATTPQCGELINLRRRSIRKTLVASQKKKNAKTTNEKVVDSGNKKFLSLKRKAAKHDVEQKTPLRSRNQKQRTRSTLTHNRKIIQTKTLWAYEDTTTVKKYKSKVQKILTVEKNRYKKRNVLDDSSVIILEDDLSNQSEDELTIYMKEFGTNHESNRIQAHSSDCRNSTAYLKDAGFGKPENDVQKSSQGAQRMNGNDNNAKIEEKIVHKSKANNSLENATNEDSATIDATVMVATTNSFTDESSYMTAAQSDLSKPNCDESTLHEIEQHEAETTDEDKINVIAVTDESIQLRERFLSEDFSSRTQEGCRVEELKITASCEKRSFGTQTGEDQTQKMSFASRIGHRTIETQTADIELASTSKYRCYSCFVEFNKKEEDQRHLQNQSNIGGTNYRHHAPSSNYEASYFTTDGENSNYGKGLEQIEEACKTPGTIKSINPHQYKSDKSVDESLLRSMINASNFTEDSQSRKSNNALATKNKDEVNESHLSSHFCADNSLYSVIASETTTYTDAYTNSTLSSIQCHDTIDKELDSSDVHYYDDESVRQQLLQLNASDVMSTSQELDSAVRSFTLYPLEGMLRKSRQRRNPRKHLKYFPPPIHQSTAISGIDIETEEFNSWMSSEADANIAIIDYRNDESQEMEESETHNRILLNYNTQNADAVKHYRFKEVTKEMPKAELTEEKSSRMSSRSRELEQLDHAVDTLDSMISNNRAFVERFESFERSAKERMQSIDSQPPAHEKESKYEFLDPLRGGLFKLKALVVEFEQFLPSSTAAAQQTLAENRPTSESEETAKSTDGNTLHPVETTNLAEQEALQLSNATHSIRKIEIKSKEMAKLVEKRSSRLSKSSETTKLAKRSESKEQVESTAIKSSQLSKPMETTEKIERKSSKSTNINEKRDVFLGKNRRSGLLTPIQSSKKSSRYNTKEEEMTTPHTAKEIFRHLNISLEDEEIDEEDEFIEAILRKRNAFTPLPGTKTCCHLCGVELIGRNARPIHYVRSHMKELAKSIELQQGSTIVSTAKDRVNSVDSGLATQGNPSPQTTPENGELSFFENIDEAVQRTPLPTLNEFAILDDVVDAKIQTTSYQLRKSKSSKKSSTTDSAVNASLSLNATQASSSPIGANLSPSSLAWIRRANLKDANVILALNRLKQKVCDNVDMLNNSRRISFASFSSENCSTPRASQMTNTDESCETTGTSSVQYKATKASLDGDDLYAEYEGAERKSGHLDTKVEHVNNNQSFSELKTSTPYPEESTDNKNEASLASAVTPLTRQVPHFVTPENNNSSRADDYASLNGTGHNSRMPSSANRSHLDLQFDISARIEQFNSTTESHTLSVDQVNSRKERRRTGYDAKTTPSVRDMVNLIHKRGFASTSKLLTHHQRRSKAKGYGTPVTIHGIQKKASRRSSSSSVSSEMNPFWQYHQSLKPFDSGDFSRTAPSQHEGVLDTLVFPIDGWQFYASFLDAAQTLRLYRLRTKKQRDSRDFN